MTTAYIGDELPPKKIRVTKGADRKFTIRRRDEDGDPVNWNAEVYITIDLEPAVRVDAVVTGNLAEMRIESTVCDQVKASTTWQAIMSETGAPTLETPFMVGQFERQDGKPVTSV